MLGKKSLVRTKHGEAHSGQDIWGQVPPSLGCGHPTSQGSGRQQNLPSPPAWAVSRLWLPAFSLAGSTAGGALPSLWKEGTPSVYEPPSQQDSAGQGETGDVEIHHQWCQKGDLLRPRGLLGVRPLVPPVARWGRPVCQAGRCAGRYMWNHGPRNSRASSPRRTKASCKALRVTEGHKPPRKQTQGWPTFGVKEEEFSDDRLNASWLQNRLDFVQNALVIFNQYGSKLGSNAVTQRQICWANAIPRASVRQ